MIYYSKSTGGFHDPSLGELPSDAVEISRSTHKELLAGQAEGKQIAAGPDGFPVLESLPQPTDAERRARFREIGTASRIDITEALIAEGILTETEAEAFAGHELPQPLLDMVDQMPAEMQRPARRRLKAASTFHRSEPMWSEVPEAIMTPEQIDRLHGFTG